MRANPKLDIETAITELAVGEALVSLLDEKGRPAVTERVFVIPPGSRIGPDQRRRAQGVDRLVARRRRLREEGRPRIGVRKADRARGGRAFRQGDGAASSGPVGGAPASTGAGTTPTAACSAG
jgi:hypothetical protein